MRRDWGVDLLNTHRLASASSSAVRRVRPATGRLMRTSGESASRRCFPKSSAANRTTRRWSWDLA